MGGRRIPRASEVQSVSHPRLVSCPKRLLFLQLARQAACPWELHDMKSTRYAVLTLILTIGYAACAQQILLPEAPSHRFFDRQNAVTFTALGGLIAIDAVTTQRLTNSHQFHEANPLWSPMVRRGWQGEMAASALGFSAALGTAYMFHKTGHHRMERWANWLSVAVEAGNDGRNLYIASAH